MNDLNYPPVLFKYLDSDGGKAMLENETLKFTPASQLNDPYDCHHVSPVKVDYPGFQVEIDLNAVFEHIGICSLSSDPLNILMWSYYNGHKGLCLGVNMNTAGTMIGYHQNVNRVVCIKKVTYQETLPILDPLDVVPRNFQDKAFVDNSEKAQRAINKFLSTKTKKWEHENEYRLILRGEMDVSKIAMAKIDSLIDCIYLGCRFPADKAPYILNIAKARNLKVYQTRLSSDGETMNCTEISYPPSPSINR